MVDSSKVLDPTYLDFMMIIFTAGVAAFAGWIFRRVEHIEKNHADIRVLNTKIDSISERIDLLCSRIDTQEKDHRAIRDALQLTREDVAGIRAAMQVK